MAPGRAGMRKHRAPSDGTRSGCRRDTAGEVNDFALLGGPLVWPHATTPQPGAGGRSFPWTTGRMLGGGSSVNGMVYVRGNRLDYDAWRDEHGCDGWGYADLLPYF